MVTVAVIVFVNFGQFTLHALGFIIEHEAEDAAQLAGVSRAVGDTRSCCTTTAEPPKLSRIDSFKV